MYIHKTYVDRVTVFIKILKYVQQNLNYVQLHQKLFSNEWRLNIWTNEQ